MEPAPANTPVWSIKTGPTTNASCHIDVTEMTRAPILNPEQSMPTTKRKSHQRQDSESASSPSENTTNIINLGTMLGVEPNCLHQFDVTELHLGRRILLGHEIQTQPGVLGNLGSLNVGQPIRTSQFQGLQILVFDLGRDPMGLILGRRQGLLPRPDPITSATVTDKLGIVFLPGLVGERTLVDFDVRRSCLDGHRKLLFGTHQGHPVSPNRHYKSGNFSIP